MLRECVLACLTKSSGVYSQSPVGGTLENQSLAATLLMHEFASNDDSAGSHFVSNCAI